MTWMSSFESVVESTVSAPVSMPVTNLVAVVAAVAPGFSVVLLVALTADCETGLEKPAVILKVDAFQQSLVDRPRLWKQRQLVGTT